MQDLLVALALVLVLEGILPFLNPRAWRETLARLASVDSRTIRIAGAVSMLCGLVMLHLFRS